MAKKYIELGQLSIASELVDFVNNELLPGIDVTRGNFWRGLDKCAHELAPKNRKLLEFRENLQKKIDIWHREKKAEKIDIKKYSNFLLKIGYLKKEGKKFKIETKNVDHFKQFIEQDIPVVFVDRVPSDLNSYRVIIDNYSAAYKATEHLIQQGCKRIAHFAGAQHLNVYKLRKNGYIDALKAHDIAPDKDLLVYMNTLSFEEGKEATSKLLNMKNPPDGIFSSNDTAAVSAIMQAKEKGVKIPDELAVIGFNDDPLASIVEPALSTISHPAMKMGELSTKRILEHADKEMEKGVSEITILDTEVIIRASSQRIK